MTIIACYSSKGGVGKTSSATNLAFLAAAHGSRTLIVDLDQQGATSFYFRVRAPEQHRARSLLDEARSEAAILETNYERLHILPAHSSYRSLDTLLDGMKKSRRRLAERLEDVADGYDVMVLDCPPTLGLVAENVFRAADVILVPVIPTTLSRRTVDQLDAFFEKSGHDRSRLRPFFSMVEPHKRMHRDTMQEMRASDPRLLKSSIPYCAEIEAMGTHREPVLRFALRSRGAAAFLELWLELQGEVAATARD